MLFKNIIQRATSSINNFAHFYIESMLISNIKNSYKIHILNILKTAINILILPR